MTITTATNANARPLFRTCSGGFLLSPATLEALRPLEQQIRQIMKADYRFFVEHPTRRYMVRPSITAELEASDLIGQKHCAPPPSGMAWFAAFHRVDTRDFRKAFVLFYAGLRDPGEAMARALFESADNLAGTSIGTALGRADCGAEVVSSGDGWL